MIWLPGILSQGGGGLPPIGKALNDCTWEQIRMISDAGLAGQYFSVGDRKAVPLNGTVGSLTFSNETYYCYIIGIDHNAAIEGTNRIHFQFGYSALSDGVNLAFVDSGYDNNKASGSWFNMNNSNSNSGGWKNSRMRTVICPAFKNALPSDLKAVLKTVTKYSDNTGGGSDQASYVTATSEEVFLLSEYEVYGKQHYANNAEQKYQAQYAWYSAGNPTSRHGHISTSSDAIWLLRSASKSFAISFAAVFSPWGTVGGRNAYSSSGFAPALCV